MVIDGLSFDGVINKEGQLNFAQLLKPGNSSSSTSSGDSSSTASKPSKLPALSGAIKLTNCRGTFTRAGNPTVYLSDTSGEIKIPDINQPITDQFNATVRVGDHDKGTITASGTVAIVSANQIAIDSGNAHQTLEITNLSLEGAKAFLPENAGIETIDGAVGLHLVADLVNGKDAALDATLTGNKPISFGGPILKGDVVTTKTLTIQIPKLTATFPNGASQWQSGRVKVGSDATPLLVQIDQGNVTAIADMTPQAVLNLIAKKPPGDAGNLLVTSNFDLARIIPQLKGTISLQPGTAIQSGGFSERLTVAMTPEKATINNVTDSTQIVGLTDGKQVTIDPINLSVTGTDLGGSGAISNLKDLDLKITSKSANGQFTGKSLSDLSGGLTINLNLLRDELGQFVDLKGKNFGGTIVVNATQQGDLTAAVYKSSAHVTLTGTQVQLTLTPPVDPAEKPAADSKPTPPTEISSPTLSITADVNSDGPSVRIDNLKAVAPGLRIRKGDASYVGDYTIDENISSQNEKLGLRGGVQIARFQSFNGSAVSFAEDLITLTDDLSLTSANKDQSLTINNLSIAMQSSGALHLDIKNGSVGNLLTLRNLQLQPNVDYDLAKLWPIVQPMMGEKYKTLKIAGQFKKQFNLTGSYLAGVTMTTAIKTVHADGDLSVASFDFNGLNLQNFVVPIALDNGKLVTVYANKPAGQNSAPPAIANGGTLDLSNWTIDLTQDPPRLSIPANKVIMSGVTINPLFANTIMANIINNPIFAGSGASGLFYCTAVDCVEIPLGNLVTQTVATNTGKADFKFSITGLHIGVGGLPGLDQIMKRPLLSADVKDGTLSIAKGISKQHISFATGPYSLDFDGNVPLADQTFSPLNLSIGPLPGFIATFTGGKALGGAGDRIVIPVEGSMSHPHVAADKVIQAIAKAAGGTVNDILKGVLGGDKNDNNPLKNLPNPFKKK